MPDIGPQTVVGIDAGGTSVRARGRRGGSIVHEGTGGPGNALSTDPAQLVRSLTQALDGCPPADVVVACVAGARGTAARDLVLDVLHDVQPGAQSHVLPDFAAAYHAFGGAADLVVVAGTGSVICSPDGNGWSVTGGNGWILGDHGSASRLGRALLDAYVGDPGVLPSPAADDIEAIYGERAPGALVRLVHTHPAPGAALALAAPVLTGLAGLGHPLAVGLLRDQMHSLAEATVAHANRQVLADGASGTTDGSRTVTVGLAGGVWASVEARAAYETALHEIAPWTTTRPGTADPLDGAVRIAAAMVKGW